MVLHLEVHSLIGRQHVSKKNTIVYNRCPNRLSTSQKGSQRRETKERNQGLMLVLDSASVCQSHKMCICVFVCSRKERRRGNHSEYKQRHTTAPWILGTSSRLLQLESTMQGKKWSSLKRSQRESGGNPAKMQIPAPKPELQNSNLDVGLGDLHLFTSSPGASYVTEAENPQSRWWRASAGISSSLLSWSLFLPLISPTQWTEGAEVHGPIQP